MTIDDDVNVDDTAAAVAVGKSLNPAWYTKYFFVISPPTMDDDEKESRVRDVFIL